MLEGKVFWFLISLAWCLSVTCLGTLQVDAPGEARPAGLMRVEGLYRQAGQSPLILLPAHVNGKGPYDFILDTGAAASLLTPELARELAVVPAGKREGMGAGGKVMIDLGAVESLAVGGARREALQVGITEELGRASAAVGAGIDGAIGYDFLKDFRLTIDYPRQWFVLEQGDVSQLGGDAVAFQIAPRKPLVIIPVHVNGRGPFHFVVDTGASISAISAELAQNLGVSAKRSEGAGVGAGGTVSCSLAKLESLRVGTATVQNVSVIVADALTPLSQAVGRNLDGIVGHNFLRQFQVTLDYPGNQLFLAPSASR